MMPYSSFLTVVLCASSVCAFDADNKDLPEVAMDACQLIRYTGYECEEHTVETSDGYLLGLQRIPFGIEEAAYTRRPAVLLQHGLTGESTNFILNPKNESLAFILADAGYDVWLGNSRGNRYSKRHVDLNPADKQFWDFTWQDMAEKDLPAVVDYMLASSGNQQIFYVGHSQGTLIAFAALSSNPEFASKISVFFAMAPVSTVGHVHSPVRYLAPLANAIYSILEDIGDFSYGSLRWVFEIIQPKCDSQELSEGECKSVLTMLYGTEKAGMENTTRAPVYTAHAGSDTSMKDFDHFAQMMNSKKMQKFNYGLIKNIEIYGQAEPTEYDVSQIDNMIVAFWSDFDALADGTDVAELLPKLKRVESHRIRNFSHLDFIYGLLAPQLVYQRILEVMGQNS